LDPDSLVTGADPHQNVLRIPNTDMGDVKNFFILIYLSPRSSAAYTLLSCGAPPPRFSSTTATTTLRPALTSPALPDSKQLTTLIQRQAAQTEVTVD
jgi:hypothetical protein